MPFGDDPVRYVNNLGEHVIPELEAL